MHVCVHESIFMYVVTAVEQNESKSKDNENKDDDDDDSVKKTEVLNNFHIALQTFFEDTKTKMNEDESLVPSVKSFTKSINSLANVNNSKLKNCLFTFTKDKTVPKGINDKTGKLIPVQQTAPPRRTRPHVGRTPGTMGRRRKGATKRKIINDDESVWYALPNPKKKKIAQSHSLKEAVEKNISGTKKH